MKSIKLDKLCDLSRSFNFPNDFWTFISSLSEDRLVTILYMKFRLYNAGFPSYTDGYRSTPRTLVNIRRRSSHVGFTDSLRQQPTSKTFKVGLDGYGAGVLRLFSPLRTNFFFPELQFFRAHRSPSHFVLLPPWSTTFLRLLKNGLELRLSQITKDSHFLQISFFPPFSSVRIW